MNSLVPADSQDQLGTDFFIHEFLRAQGPFVYAALASSRIKSAAFSAIIITGALVLPDVMVGIIDASTTRAWTLMFSEGEVVPAAGVEPATYGLQNRCSTN